MAEASLGNDEEARLHTWVPLDETRADLLR